MNIQTDFIPETSRTSTTVTSTTTTTTSTSWEIIPTSTVSDIFTTEVSEYPPGIEREIIIKGLSEIEKDIFIISLSGMVLILMILLVVICLKWRKSRGRTYEIQNMSAGSSMTIFNSSKLD